MPEVVTSLPDLIEAVRSAVEIRILGSGTGGDFSTGCQAPELKVGLTGIVSHDQADQVVAVWAGTPIAELQEELAKTGHCIPLGPGPWERSPDGTVGGRLSLNLPHSLESTCGNWRDWVLGLTVVRPDGTVAKGGSKAVKNVAGYDVQKLFVGSRGTLGVIVQVILRTYPLAALSDTDMVTLSPARPVMGYIQRVPTTDFARATDEAGEAVLATHPGTSTLYRGDDQPSRYEGDWLIGWGRGRQNIVLNDPDQIRLMKRAKQIFDPTGKLNPGEFGL